MRVHFTGIKGVGMTALALAGQDRGWQVRGSDTKEPQITDQPLKKREIEVFTRFTPRNISKIEKSRRWPLIDRLIYTGAHHGFHNVEPKWAVSRKIPVQNYALALGDFFQDKKQLCVCGVGGKTTTAAMLATILYLNKQKPSWVIGTSEVASLPAPGHWDKQGEWVVIEADEYVADPGHDRTPKFFYLNPAVIICTNIKHDHPDIYPTIKETVNTYVKFFKKLPPGGLLLLSKQAEGRVEEKLAQLRENGVRVEVYDDNKTVGALKVPGEYNLKNALAALAAAEYVGVSRVKALAALSKFTGLKRRFEFHGEVNGVRLYDDYAHHPHEIEALIKAAREEFPDRRLRLVFHPHTYSRTKALFAEFVQVLTQADEAILFPVFASAREEKDPTVSSKKLTEAVIEAGGQARFVKSMKKLVEYLEGTAKPRDIIFTVGAGDIYLLHEELKKSLPRTSF